MFLALALFDTAVYEGLLLGIPESVGLLLFGIGLITMAILLRWVLGRKDDRDTEDNIGEKV